MLSALCGPFSPDFVQWRGMAPNRRANPEVVEKRRAARQFNDLLLAANGNVREVDGRTEKRRQRLLDELKEGQARASKSPLKPIEILTRVATLFELGMSAAAIRKVCKPPRRVVPTTELVDGVRALHAAYSFPIEAYAFVGVDEEMLEQAGVTGSSSRALAKTRPSRRSANPGIARAKKARTSARRRDTA